MSRRVQTDIGLYRDDTIAYQEDDSQFDHNAAYAQMHQQQDSPCDLQQQQSRQHRVKEEKHDKHYYQYNNQNNKAQNKYQQQQQHQQDEQDQQDLHNYKGIYFNDDACQKFQDPLTGAHFQYTDMCRRLNNIIQKEKRKEALLYGGVTLTEPVQKLKLCQEIDVPQEGVKSKEFTGSLRFKNKFDQGSKNNNNNKDSSNFNRATNSFDKMKYQQSKPYKMAQINATNHKAQSQQYQLQQSSSIKIKNTNSSTSNNYLNNFANRVIGGGTGGSGGTRNYSNNDKESQQTQPWQHQNLKQLLLNYQNLSSYQQQQILQKVMRGKSNSSNVAQNQGNYDLTGGMKNSNTYAGSYNNNNNKNNNKSGAGGSGNDYLKSIMQKYQKNGLIGSYTAQKKVYNQQQLQHNNSNGGKSPILLKKGINAGYSSVEKNKKNISLSGNKKDRMSSYEGRRLYQEMLQRTLDKKKKLATQVTQQRQNNQANEEQYIKTEGNDLMNLYHQKKRNLGLQQVQIAVQPNFRSSGRSIQLLQVASQNNSRKMTKTNQKKSGQIPISLSSTGYGQKSRNNQNVRNGSSYGQTPITKSINSYYNTGQMAGTVRSANNIKSYTTLEQLNNKSASNKFSIQGNHLKGSKSQIGVIIPKKQSNNTPKTYVQNNYNYRVPSSGVIASTHYASGSTSQLQSALFHSSASKTGSNPNNMSSNSKKDIKSGSADKRKNSLTKGTFQSYSSSIKQQMRKKPTGDASDRVAPIFKSSSKFGAEKFSKSSYSGV